MTDRITLALIQHACVDNTAQNVATAIDMIRDAASRGANLAVTVELFTSRYFAQTQDPAHFALAETIPGPTTNKLCELAKQLKIAISVSLFEKRTQGIYHNTSVMIDPTGNIAGKYRKMHIPDDPSFYEKFYFTPGDLNWQVFNTQHAKVGTLICWDQWFPEAARLTAMRGAEVLLYPTAIGYLDGESTDDHAQQRDAWQTIQRAHAIANGLFVAAVNRVGVENHLRFWGSSFVVDPTGKVIAQADENETCVLIAECDLSLIERTRQMWPFFRDRRIDAYNELTQRLCDQ